MVSYTPRHVVSPLQLGEFEYDVDRLSGDTRNPLEFAARRWDSSSSSLSLSSGWRCGDGYCSRSFGPPPAPDAPHTPRHLDDAFAGHRVNAAGRAVPPPDAPRHLSTPPSLSPPRHVSRSSLDYLFRPAPPAQAALRERLDRDFAVLLMRTSYAVADDLDFVPMDEFQRDFFLLRQVWRRTERTIV